MDSETLAADGLSRLVLGLGFDRLDMGTEDEDAQVYVRPEKVRGHDLAMNVAVSLAIDLREMRRQGWESLIPWWRAGAEEARSEREEYGDDQEGWETYSDAAAGEWIGSRIPGTHGGLADAMPWGVAFVEVNLDLIVDLGHHLRSVRVMTPMQVEEFAGDRLAFPDREAEDAARTSLDPYIADLLVIDEAVLWIEER